jgi:hypothetical protein
MKDQNLDVISGLQIRDILLIPIKADIKKLFKTNSIQFQISIKDDKIIIESPKILADLDFQDNNPRQEAINV